MPKFEEVRTRLNALGDVISKEIFPGLGFMLIVFEFHKSGISNYISNAERADMVKALRETADRLAGAQDIRPDQQN